MARAFGSVKVYFAVGLAVLCVAKCRMKEVTGEQNTSVKKPVQRSHDARRSKQMPTAAGQVCD